MSSLIVCGTALTACAAWSVMRMILLVIFQVMYTDPTYGPESTGVQEFDTQVLADPELTFGEQRLILILLIAFVFILFFADLLIRIYVGLSARSVGRDGKKKSAYLVWGIILSFFSTIFLTTECWGLVAAVKENGIIDTVVSVVMDSASLYLALEVVVSGFREKRLRKKLGC